MTKTEKKLIQAIRAGGSEMDIELKRYVLDRDLNETVHSKMERMGGGQKDADLLFEDAVVQLCKLIRNDKFSNYASLKDFIFEHISLNWAEKLFSFEKLRNSVLEKIAKDVLLKQRIEVKMRKLGCQAVECEDYYQQGFVKMNEIFSKKKYKGGDVKALFFRVCEHIRLNDLRKSKEELPEILPERPTSEMIDSLERKEKRELLETWLSKIGEKCRTTLRLWNEGFSMKEIAEQVPYKDFKEAAVAKYRCMKKLYSLIEVEI